MIVNPYQEFVSLHDMAINSLEIDGDTAYLYLDQAYYFTGEEDYILDNPVVIIRGLVDIESNKDYPFRIMLFKDDEAYRPTLADFKDFKFEILEEAYGFGLVHFYGIATQYADDAAYAYDGFLDIHYSGDLEIKWDNKKLVEV